MDFLYINVLYFMLIPFFILAYLISSQKDSFEKLFSKEIIENLRVTNQGMSKNSRNILFFASIFFMIIALSRPVMNEQEQSIKQELNAIVVAIDVSKSMLAQDLYPTRLDMAKLKLEKIIEKSKHNALGLVIFAKSAFILSPITQDFNSLKYIVKNFDSKIDFNNGSNIYAMLEASNKLFKNYEHKNIILLSDGGNNTSYKDEIDFLEKNKLNLYTISLASNKPTPIPTKDGYMTDSNGDIITIKRNESIKKLSFINTGAYVNYTLNDKDVDAVLNDIFTKIEKDKISSKKYKIYTELFYYPLGLALLLLLLSFSSFRSIKSLSSISKALVLSLLIFSSSNLKAGLFDFQTINQANEDYKNKDYKKAQKQYEKIKNSEESLYNQANAAYKQKDYKKALELYDKTFTYKNEDLEYKKLHNMGNTYVNLNKLEEAKESYEKALKIKENKETKENLETVKKELEKKKKENKKNQENKKDSKKSKENKKDKKKKDSKNKEQKDGDKSKNKKDNKKNQEKKKDSKESKENKKPENKDSKGEKSESKKSSKNIKKNIISDLEEKKWLKQLENKQVPILLRKVQSKEENKSSSPW